MNRLILSISLLLTFCFAATSQGGKGEGRDRMHKEIKAQKVSYITQELELTPEEAQLFWPVYNELDKKKNALKKEERVLFLKVRNAGISESELVQISDDMIAGRMKEAQLNKEYFERFKKILPIKKILKLHYTEKQFRNMLLRTIKEKGCHECSKRK